MPIKQEDLLAAARRTGANIMHSDDDLAQRLEPATPEVPGPEAGPSNDELVDNSHTENGASPVLDGDIHSPERPNVNAVREAIETQAEMEVGKPIEQKQEEVKADVAAGGDGTGKSVTVEKGDGGKVTININIASNKVDRAISVDPKPASPLGGEKRHPRAEVTSGGAGVGAFGGTDLSATPNMEKHASYHEIKEAFLKNASHLTIADVKKAGQEFLHMVRTAAVRVSQGQDEQGFHMLLDMNGREYVLRGDDAESFRKEYAAIPKPEAKVNALVEKYLWKMQPYKKPTIQHPTPDKERAEGLADADAYWAGHEKQPKDYKRYMTQHASLIKMAGDYWGYDNWVTGHTALMINNESVPYSTLKRLVRNALKKQMSPKELATQLARFFKKQAQESAKFYAENAADARGERGKYEKQQLEGTQPEPSGNKARDVVDQLVGLWYEHGGQSDWEAPVGEVDWEDIASSEMESERAENPKAYPQTSKEDEKFMKGVGIKMESLKAAKAALAKVRTTMANEKRAGEGVAKTPEEIEKEAGFNFFFPGQALREVAPELQHELVDYPNDTNTPMLYPDIVGDTQEVPEEVALAAALEGALDTTIVAYVSTSPAGAAGIGRDGKPEVLEGAPLRKENDIRGMMFTDEFYGQQEGVPGRAFASKQAFIKAIMATEEAKVFGQAFAFLNGLKKTAGADEAKQFAIFLKKVCGEVAATFVAMFKVTSRPMLDQVPGKGEIQLAQVEQPQGLSSFNIYNQSSRVKYLMDKLTDSEIKDAINGSSAQAAVWHDGEEGGYVYEVFVRIDDIDTESLIATYSFIIGTKE